MNNNDLFLGFASNCSMIDLACSRQSKSEQEVPVYDLCRGSAEIQLPSLSQFEVLARVLKTRFRVFPPVFLNAQGCCLIAVNAHEII